MASGTHDMTGDVDSAMDIHEELSNLDRGATHAAIAWVGYDPPPEAGDKDTLDVFDDDRASKGGWKLAYALDGFQETRAVGDEGPKDPRVNVHAHSYGTNTSAHALAAVKHEVDSFSMYGSAGIPADLMDRVAGKDGAASTDDVEAGDLNVKTNEEGDPMVFASESSWDWTARVGRTFGDDRIDPTDESFGAQVNYSGGMFESDAVDGENVTGHSRTFEDSPDEYGYLDPGTEHFQGLVRTLAGVEESFGMTRSIGGPPLGERRSTRAAVRPHGQRHTRRTRSVMLTVTSVLLLSGLMAGCGDDASDVVTVDQEGGEELVVDWDEGLTYEEQVEEIKLVNEAMTKHFGEKVLPHVDGNPWDLETYLSQPGIPNSSSRAEDHFYFRINYDFSKVEPGDDVQQKALAVLEEIGLTPNGDLPAHYDADRKLPLHVAGGEEEHGRLFMIRQLGSDAGISAMFSTRHSDHESMRELSEKNFEGWSP